MKEISFDENSQQVLFTIPLFRDLPQNIKDVLLDKLDFHLYDVQKGDIVAEQGVACKKLYILLRGKLEVNIIDSGGEEVLIEHIVASRAFATPHLFKEDNRFPATFKAVENSVLLTATKESTFQLISEYPDILKSFLSVTGRCNACTTMRLDILSRKTIRERLLVYLFKNMLRDSSKVRITHSLTQLAKYLNVSRPALSTEFNKLEKEGMIKRIDKDFVELSQQASQEL